jgi:peptide/nickel transport system ATP-binding protein
VLGQAVLGQPVLELRNLAVAYRGQPVLRGVSLQVGAGEAYGLVGESGCGKSTAALAVMRALPRNGTVTAGQILVAGQDVAALDRAALRQLRARTISMVYQDASRALNPTLTIGRQMAEAFEVLGSDRALAASRAMLDRVRIADPARVMGAYPHQLSGGMQQRVVIGMALAKDPALLVLDEPTTGLDATVEAQILDLLADLRRNHGTALLFISHNIGVIGRMCDRMGVLYAGTLVEEGETAAVLRHPLHPYTTRLLRCVPTAGRRKRDGPLDSIPGFLPPPGPLPPGCVFAPRCVRADDICRSVAPPIARDSVAAAAGHSALCHYPGVELAEPRPVAVRACVTPGGPVLRASGVSKSYGAGSSRRPVLIDVTLTLAVGQTLGLVGESGSGKTTLGRVLLGLTAPDPGGVVALDGKALAPTARARSRADLKALQVVFQNPDSALNRSHTVRRLMTRPLARLAGLAGAALQARLDELLAAVRLTPAQLPMRPAQLSGGLKQRVAIARAFAGQPRVVICDEPTSALDVSVQAAILNLLVDLQSREGTSFLFISHDLGVVRYLADRIAVLYRGRIVETGPADAVFDGPHHPYTEALLAAVPGAAGPPIVLPGDGAGVTGAAGCVFRDRCPRKFGAICDTEQPKLTEQDGEAGHAISCHLPREALGRRNPPEI